MIEKALAQLRFRLSSVFGARFRPRGFGRIVRTVPATLRELLGGVGVAALVIAGVLVALPGQAHASSATWNYPAVVLSDGPLAYWRLGEASGATAIDATGHGLNGRYSIVALGTGGAIAGDLDTAASFDGSYGFVTTPIVRGDADLTPFRTRRGCSVPDDPTASEVDHRLSLRGCAWRLRETPAVRSRTSA